MAVERVTAALAFAFALMAVILAGVGTYGLLAYIVAQRQREIGIRLALGARRNNIVGLFGYQTLAMLLPGLLLGLVATIMAGRWLRGLLFGVSPADPLSLAVAAIFVILVTSVATAVPTLRAMRVQPARALRQEN